MPSNTQNKIHVAIVGGGISGICTAIALQRFPHIRTTIYEAASEFAEIGAGLLLGPNAKRALNLISSEAHEAYTRLQTGNQDPEHKHTWYEFRYSTGPKAGQKITKVQSEIGQSSIHRAKFLDCLVNLVPKDICLLGKRLDSVKEYDDHVELLFQDGTTNTAHCVIGADGIHSQTRKCLFKENWEEYEPQFSGVIAYRALVPMDEARRMMGDELPMNSFTHCGKNSVVASFPIDFGETFNMVACSTGNKTWEGPWTQSTTVEEAREVFRDFEGGPKQLIEAMNRPNAMKWSVWTLPYIPVSHRDRICLIGDAVHAAVPMHAAGAGQAIEDAFVLAAVIGNMSSPREVTAAFRGYDKIRLPRAQLNGKMSADAVEVFSLRKPGVMDDSRALKEEIQYRMDWLWNRDIALEAEQACLIMDNIIQSANEED